MIMEFRTYTLQRGKTPAVLEKFAAVIAARTKVSALAGAFCTEVGPLNQVVMMWPYADLAEREQAHATEVENWPPQIDQFAVGLKVESVRAAPFSPKIAARSYGSLYEIRRYTFSSGSMPRVMDAWAKQIDKRTEFSPLVFAGYTEFGVNDVLTHIWAYGDYAQRLKVRDEARKAGAWPAKLDADIAVVRQENMLVTPVSFSPWQ